MYQAQKPYALSKYSTPSVIHAILSFQTAPRKSSYDYHTLIFGSTRALFCSPELPHINRDAVEAMATLGLLKYRQNIVKYAFN